MLRAEEQNIIIHKHDFPTVELHCPIWTIAPCYWEYGLWELVHIIYA